MISQKTKLQIIAVSGVYTSATVKNINRKVVLTVAEISNNNPFGHTKEPSAQFEIEVHNHNIENFHVTPGLAGCTAIAELYITFYKKDAGTPTQNRFLVNDIVFEI